jgi:hypothetical protein
MALVLSQPFEKYQFRDVESMRRIRWPDGDSHFDHSKIALEQYKLYVEMSDRISARRMIANSFFLAVQTAIIAGVFASGKIDPGIDTYSRIGLALCGIAIAILWLTILRSYRQLNSAKFRVIHDLEKMLPAAPFAKEWELLGQQRKASRYLALSRIEQCVPLCIAGLYFFYIAGLIQVGNVIGDWLRRILS